MNIDKQAMNQEEPMEPEPPQQKSSGIIIAGLGAILLVAGLLICAFVYGVVLKNDHSEFGGISEMFLVICGGAPLAFTGLIVIVAGLIMSSAEKKR